MDPCSGRWRWLIGKMTVNSHSQLVSLNQTADAEPTTHVGWAAGYAGTPCEPSLNFRRRRPAPQEAYSLWWLSLFQA